MVILLDSKWRPPSWIFVNFQLPPLMRYNRQKLQFITLLTAICIVSHIENSKNDKGYIT